MNLTFFKRLEIYRFAERLLTFEEKLCSVGEVRNKADSHFFTVMDTNLNSTFKVPLTVHKTINSTFLQHSINTRKTVTVKQSTLTVILKMYEFILYY